MIRPARPDDAAAIRAVAQASWLATYGPLDGDARIREHVTGEEFYAPAAVRERIAATDGVVLVADDPADGVVGYAYLTWRGDTPYSEPGDADLRHLYVHPDHAGAGLGSRLLSAALERLPGEVERLTVCFHPLNDGARAFYEARGFEPVEHEELAPPPGFEDPDALPPDLYARAR